MVGGQVGGEWEVRWLCGLTNCFIHMQTGPERLWSLQQADNVSPWWMTVHIASRRAAALSLMQHRESRYQILLLSMNLCFIFESERQAGDWGWEGGIILSCLVSRLQTPLSVLFLVALSLVAQRRRCWGGRADRWSYTLLDNSPRGSRRSRHRNQQAAVAMIDGLMTELCKSFNPFIKLDGGGGGTWCTLSSHLCPSGFCKRHSGALRASARADDMRRWELLWHISPRKLTLSTVFLWPVDGAECSLTFTVTLSRDVPEASLSGDLFILSLLS